MDSSVVLSFFIVLLLVGVRIPVAAVLSLAGFLGVWYIDGWQVAVGVLKSIPFEFAASWSLSSVPMYLLMGYFAFHSGMADRLYESIRVWVGRFPGSLAITTVFGCAGFGAVCGSSGATAAAFGRIAIPVMLKDGYQPALAAGSIAASGTMGSLMPPSVLMIIYAVLTEESIGRVFMAGVIPCIVSAAIYALMIYARVKINPVLAPTREIRSFSWDTRLKALGKLWDVYIVVLIVFGGIYSGIFTATEAGACGAFAVLAVNLPLGRLNKQKIKESVKETISITSMVLLIAVGANLYTRFLALGGLNQYLLDWATSGELSVGHLMFILFGVYFVLGMFLDPIGCMLLTIPTFLPVFDVLHVNMVWFAIIVIKNMELAMITPPVGLNVFIIKGVIPEVPIEKIFRGIFWFAVMDVLTLLIIYLFPQLSLFLPNYMFGK
jgi:tripartite ATP-independent transporter DctM subunit